MDLKQFLLASLGVVAAVVSAVVVVATVTDSGAVQHSDAVGARELRAVVAAVEPTHSNEQYLGRVVATPASALSDRFENHPLADGQIRQWRSVVAHRHIIAQPGEIDIVGHASRELIGTCGISIELLTPGIHSDGGM